VDVRTAQEAEIDPLAKLWYDGWQDAHAQILPAQLTRLRTLETFERGCRQHFQMCEWLVRQASRPDSTSLSTTNFINSSSLRHRAARVLPLH
jgi:hypothetical protein